MLSVFPSLLSLRVLPTHLFVLHNICMLSLVSQNFFLLLSLRTMLDLLETSIIQLVLFNLCFVVYNTLRRIYCTHLISLSISVFDLIFTNVSGPPSFPYSSILNYPCLKVKPYHFLKTYVNHDNQRVVMLLWITVT